MEILKYFTEMQFDYILVFLLICAASVTFHNIHFKALFTKFLEDYK